MVNHGGNRRSEKAKSNNNNVMVGNTEQGNSRAYSIARVQRECDSELEPMSVNLGRN